MIIKTVILFALAFCVCAAEGATVVLDTAFDGVSEKLMSDIKARLGLPEVYGDKVSNVVGTGSDEIGDVYFFVGLHRDIGGWIVLSILVASLPNADEEVDVEVGVRKFVSRLNMDASFRLSTFEETSVVGMIDVASSVIKANISRLARR